MFLQMQIQPMYDNSLPIVKKRNGFKQTRREIVRIATPVTSGKTVCYF